MVRTIGSLPHAPFAGLSRLRGIVPTKTTALPISELSNRSQVAEQQGGGTGGGGGRGTNSSKQHDPPDKDSGSGNNILLHIEAQWPVLLVGVAIPILLGTFHQCVFAIPELQRDVTGLKSGHAELKAEFKAGHAELKAEFKAGQAELKAVQAELKAGQAELKAELQSEIKEVKLILQRLCVAMGKSECALPPIACA